MLGIAGSSTLEVASLLLEDEALIRRLRLRLSALLPSARGKNTISQQILDLRRRLVERRGRAELLTQERSSPTLRKVAYCRYRICHCSQDARPMQVLFQGTAL